MDKIYRSKTDRKFAGVCGGLAVKLGIDSTIIRLVWVLASILLGAGSIGFIIYIVCAFVIPEEPDYIDVDGDYTNNQNNSQNFNNTNNQQNTQNYTNTNNGQDGTYYNPNVSNTSGSYNQSGSYDQNK